MIANAILLALRELRRNMLRATLTTLGIVIGVGAVIALVTLGNGASESVTSSIASLGRNLVILQPGAVSAAAERRAARRPSRSKMPKRSRERSPMCARWRRWRYEPISRCPVI